MHISHLISMHGMYCGTGLYYLELGRFRIVLKWADKCIIFFVRNFVVILIIILLSACSLSPVVPTREMKTPTPSLAQFIPPYNENSSPIIPPDYSVSAGIWSEKNGIPATPIESEPQFINYPEPKAVTVDPMLLENAGCTLDENDYPLNCNADSPLATFDCFLTKPYFKSGLEPAYPVVATCGYEPNKKNTNDEYLHRVGCILVENVGYIFWINNKYTLVNTLAGMKDFFAPIDDSDEALSYAQAVTGLKSIFTFEIQDFGDDHERVYFQEIIEGTHVKDIDEGYSVQLYHFQACGCDTFITSQVNIVVNRAGDITWDSAIPVYMDIIPKCAD